MNAGSSPPTSGSGPPMPGPLASGPPASSALVPSALASGALASSARRQDHQRAADVATSTGKLLVEFSRTRSTRTDARRFGDQADQLAHAHIVRELRQSHPLDAICSEESVEGDGTNERVGEGGRTWIVDPLDGTRHFSAGNSDEWAVHIALVVNHVAVAGAVAIPARQLTLTTAAPPVVPTEARTQALTRRPLRIVVSRSRAPDVANNLAAMLGADVLQMGSAGVKAMSVVLGDSDIYVHCGGQYEWDSAAPVAVAQAAGLHASRLDGSALVYDQRDPWIPDLLICRTNLAARILNLTSTNL